MVKSIQINVTISNMKWGRRKVGSIKKFSSVAKEKKERKKERKKAKKKTVRKKVAR